MTVATDSDILIAQHTVRLDNLELWQRNQNGTLVRLEGKIDNLREDMNAKVDSIRTWLIGVMGGLVVALLLLSANLILKKP